jgi:hypothetical protein
LAAAILFLPAGLLGGPYNEMGIQSTDPDIVGWAKGYRNLIRGPMDIGDPGSGNVSFGSAGKATGPADCDYLDVVSIGDGGEITMTFNPPITNGPGADFAVFENGFPSGGYLFAELAFVEVSTDGNTFARFPCVSLTPDPIEGYDILDPSDVRNLAGKHPGGNMDPCLGTPFDLNVLAGEPSVVGGQVDIDRIRYVRVVDVIGDGTTFDDATPVHPVYDPYPTALSQGGFDLQAIAVLHELDDADNGGDENADGEGDGSGCYIATAAYGSPFATKIDLLRSFRDTYLVKSPVGRKMVEFYYRNAEPWATWIAKHDTLRAFVRIMLAPVIGMVWLLLGMP